MSTILSPLLLVLCAVIQALQSESRGQTTSTTASLLWGPYRSNLYLGIRPRIPHSLLMGLMWSNADNPGNIAKNLRHTCEQDEGMAGYGWTAYDVRKGGVQFVNDTENAIDLITQFVKVSNEEESGSWGLRVRGIPNVGSHKKTTVIFYLGVEDPKSRISCKGGETSNTSGSNAICVGTTIGLGDFSVQIAHYQGESSRHMAIESLTVPKDTIWQAKSVFNDQFEDKINHKSILVDDPGEGNLHFVQQSFEGEFEFDVLYSSGQPLDAITSSTLESGVQDASSEFNKRFQSVYSPQTPFGDEQYTMFSQALLSNLMGGIGYFYGTSKVDKSSTLEYAETDNNFWEAAAAARSHTIIEEQGPHQLFSAVPSRPFFPRGFLWDEGFHLEVILNWDMDLALEILWSWFDLMDEKGWIAREQILGPEARSKVPPEFQTQYLHYANPPTLFLVVEAFVARLSGASDYSGAPSHYLSDGAAGKKFVKAIYSKMRKHFEWFCETQKGNLKHYQHAGSQFKQGYRWQGRTPRHTLTSGLDDYPRAQPPGPEELHVDALSWVGSMAIALGRVAAFLEEEGDKENFLKQEIEVIQSLDNIHWSEHNRVYCDATIVDGTRVEKVCHKGYVSLFPFLVGLMSSDHSRLDAVLDLIRNPEELWSPHGIRSLSLKDIFYGTDENYWRSPVWININYMVIRRLLELAQKPGLYRYKALDIYTELRLNLVNTVFKSWKATGFAWEQYNPDTGKGQRTQHFTGWTSLITIIMNMPDLQPRSLPQVPRYGDKVRWNRALTLMVMGMLLLRFLFRRRLIKSWRGLMKT